MASKQILAQIGVFALLGLNVGAYYVFWPHRESDNRSEAKAVTQEKGATQLLPEKKVKPAPPTELPAGVPTRATPLQIANPPAPALEQKANDDPIAKLLQHIERENGAPRPVNQSENGDREMPTTPGVGVASAITPKVPPTPADVPGVWLVRTEMIGPQTKVVAKLKQSAIEFTIVCDRVEVPIPGGTIHAIGKVKFQGAGMTGTCKRLTLPLHETRLTFQDQVEIVQDAKLASNLSSERIVWDLPAIPVEPVSQPQFAPAESRILDFVPAPPPLLGTPK